MTKKEACIPKPEIKFPAIQTALNAPVAAKVWGVNNERKRKACVALNCSGYSPTVFLMPSQVPPAYNFQQQNGRLRTRFSAKACS